MNTALQSPETITYQAVASHKLFSPAGGRPCLQTALNLARLGYYVHPLVPGDKIPLAEHGYNDATRDEDQIRQWWRDWPKANVGINLHRTGLVDIAPDCPERATEFKAKGMAHTVCYTSGGGPGHWHAFYRLPKGGPVARACVPDQYDIMSQGNAVAPGSVHPSGRTYELKTRLLPVEDLPLAPQWAIDILQEHAKAARKTTDTADWTNLPDGATLAQSRRFQALVKVNDQLRAVCGGEHVTIAGDSSTSAQRAVFVNQLLRARYPHREIRALADHFSGVLESKAKYFEDDVDRLIAKYTPEAYAPESTGVLQYDEPLRGGRHYEITAGELLDRYHEYADCGINGLALDWTVNEAADRLHVSTGTIKRREAELAQEGKIERHYGIVILSPSTWEIRSQCIELPYIEDAPAENTIGSQFDLPQQDAPEAPENAVCIKERAHAEVTHLPAEPANPPVPRVLRCGPWYYVTDGVRCGATARDEALAWAKWAPELDEWAGIDQEIEDWKRMTPDGRKYAQLEARRAGDAASVERLRAILRGPDVARQRPLALGPPGDSAGGVFFRARRAPDGFDTAAASA